MISYVAKLINLFATTIQSVFQVAWLIGKVIVAALTEISSIILNILENVILFFQIVYEDNVSILTEEIPNATNELISTFLEQWSILHSSVILIYCDLGNKVNAFIGTVKWLVDAVLIIVCEVLVLLKNLTIFLGDTLWLIVTFVPIHLPELIKAVIKTVTDFFMGRIVEAYMVLLKITNFLTDVPLESFIGITSAIVTVRLCIHFRESIESLALYLYWSLVRKCWYYYYAFYNYFIDTEIREITRMSSGNDISHRVDNPASAVDENAADALCVICQERQKCVLTLPCRHVCLCSECCMRLYGYQRTCPICRTFIYHSVTVYL